MSKLNWVLFANNIGCIYPELDDNGEPSHILKGAYVKKLFIPSEGLTTIIGESGSGKSTLLGLLSALRQENTPKCSSKALIYITQKGEKTSLLNGERPKLGELSFVFQDSYLIKTIEARKNGELGEIIASKCSGSIGSTEDYAKRFGVEGRLNVMSESLSGGQAQRFAVIRALVVNPKLLICDEPTSNLDDKTSEIVMEEIRDWAISEGCAVLWVTHDLPLAAKYSDYALAVHEGHLILEEETSFPFSLEGMSFSKKLDRLREIGNSGELVSDLTHKDVIKHRSHNASRNEYEYNRVSSTYLDFNHILQLQLFLFRCAFSEVMAPMTRAKQKGKKGLNLLFEAISGMMKNSMTWVLLLGFLVFYTVVIGLTVSGNYFSQHLQSPEVSHFLIRTRGGTEHELSLRKLKLMEKSMLAHASDATKAPALFGRRSEIFTDIWVSDESCTSKTRDHNIVTVPLRVFEVKEPLFSEVATISHQGLSTTLKNKSLTGELELIVTPVLLSMLRKDNLESVCIDIFGPERVSVSALVEAIPGGGSQHFIMGLEENKYRNILMKKRPPSLINVAGKFTLPSYTEAALYFDYQQVSSVICAFDKFDGCENSNIKPVYSDFKINIDIMQQIKDLLHTSGMARIALYILGVIFAATISLSTGLAVSAFVTENRKSISVMRVFGYSYFHVLILLLAQFLLIGGVALMFFLILLAIFEFSFVNIISDTFVFPIEWLSLSVGTVIRSTLFLIVVTVLVVSLVLASWWKKHKYLGETLQTL